MTGPVVPRANPDLTPTAPLPNVRRNPNVPAGAFGVPSLPDLSVVQRNVAEIVADERRKADNTAIQDADNQAAALETNTLNDPDNGVLNRHGEDAMTADADFTAAWQKGVSTIEGRLTTEQQRQAFRRMAAERYVRAEGQVQDHIAAERDLHRKDVFQTGLSFAQDQAVSAPDPATRADAIDRAKVLLDEFGSQMGWGAELTSERKAQAVSVIHAGVIDRMLANRKDLDAVDYLTKHRDEMSGEALTKAESLISRGSVLGAAQRSADAIMKTATSLKQGLDAAGLILDPQVREEAEQRVRRSFEDRTLAEHEAQTQNEIAAGAVVRKTGRFDAIPVKLLDGMTPIQIRDLKLLEESLRRRPSDPETVIRLRNMSAFDRDGFAKLDLGQYKDQLSDADLRALQSTQRTLMNAAATQARTTRTRQQKDLSKAQASADFYKSQGLDVPAATSGKIKALHDSLGTTPKTPGAPLPTTPAGSGAPQSTGGLPLLQLPGTKPPTDPDAAGDRYEPTIPTAWLEHAETDPAYANYLEIMGVRR